MKYDSKNLVPQGWLSTTIDEVANVSRHKCNPQDYPELPFIGLEHVEPRTTRIAGFVPASEMRSTANYFEAGDVLYSRLRPYLNKVVCPDFNGLCSSEFIVFKKSEDVSSKYLMYFLFSSDFVSFASHLNTGDRPRVDFEQFKTYSFPLPPLSEQHRIVEVIEAEFTRLDAGVAALKRLRANLKRYKAAVLKAAAEGKLVPQDPNDEPAATLLKRILRERRLKWEADQRAKGRDPQKLKYEEPKAPNTEALPELPEGWVWATIQQVGDVQLGRQRAPQHHSGEFMRPYLRVANVFEDRIDVSDVLEMNFTPSEYETYRLFDGDILLNEGQSLELVGRPAIYRDEVPGACFQNTLVRFRVADGLMPEYALSIFRAYLHNGRFQRIARWTTNIAHLGAQRFAVLEFPLPSLNEQRKIVDKVEELLSVMRFTEKLLVFNIKRAERLRQAILRDAYAGRLVAQDPNDEPAAELLKRIQKARRQRTDKRTS